MKAIDVAVVTGSVAVLALSTVVLGSGGHHGTPGYEYGRLNCGKLGGKKTLKSCQTCCDAEQKRGLHSEEWRQDCYALCGENFWPVPRDDEPGQTGA